MNAPETQRILLVDDDPRVLANFPTYFAAVPHLSIAATASSGHEAIERLKAECFDIVLSDVRMPGLTGIDLLSRVQQLPEPPTFIAMTAFDSDETMLRLLELGAAGYLVKGSRLREVIDAVNRALDGGTSLSPECISRLVQASLRRKPWTFTPRIPPNLDDVDKKIVVLIAEGKTNRQIADFLCYAESTIRNRISKMMKMCNAASRAQLIAIVNGLD